MNVSKPKSNSDERPVEVPASALSDEVLEALVESFVLREGTDYGAQEVSLAKKIEQVKRQLSSGEVRIVFDASTESVSLLTKVDFKRAQREAALREELSGEF